MTVKGSRFSSTESALFLDGILKGKLEEHTHACVLAHLNHVAFLFAPNTVEIIR
jgi:hypothetical protein